LPTRWGDATLLVYAVDGVEVRVLRFGEPCGEVYVRLHAACATSEVFGSLKCDCREQLEASLATMGALGAGILVYTPAEEGRGIGFVEKVRAYALQADGLDTVDANLALGHAVDARDHRVGAAVLRALGVERALLATNNPDKLAACAAAGIHCRRAPLLVPVGAAAAGYLRTKGARCGHLLPDREA
ncbi:MAG: GTP cyclohydrolase II, partial [Myxococcota bacterium]